MARKRCIWWKDGVLRYLFLTCSHTGFAPQYRRMTTAAVALDTESGMETWLHDRASEYVGKWLQACDDLLDACQNQYVADGLTSLEDKRLARVLKWFLRTGGMLTLQAGDPDFPDKKMKKEIEGRLARVEFYWEAFTNPMSYEEADKLIAEIFPG